MTSDFMTVVHDGKLINIDDGNFQVGDTVILQTADLVPADLILVEANGLEIDECDITGELLPVIKKLEDGDVILYAGSKVTGGTGKGIVIAVGERTEYGMVLKQGWEREQPYRFRLIERKYLGLVLLLLQPLMVQAAQSTNIIGVIAFYLLLIITLVIFQNDEFFKHILVSGELKKLENSNIQIHDGKVLERMSKMDTLCFDKTGVLTTRQMEGKNIYLTDGMNAADSASAIGTDAFRRIKDDSIITRHLYVGIHSTNFGKMSKYAAR